MRVVFAIQRPQRRGVAFCHRHRYLCCTRCSPLPRRSRWRRRARSLAVAATVRPRSVSAHGRLRMVVRNARDGHRCARRAVRAVLHVARGPRPSLLLVPHGVHGGDARHGAIGQSDPAGRLLGTHRPHVVHAHRLLVPPPRCPPRRADGGDRNGRRGVQPTARRAHARRDRRQLRPRCGARRGRPDSRASVVRARPRARRDRRTH